MIHMLRLISMAIDDEYQELISDTLLECGCAVKAAPIKRDARMRNKALSIDDHRFENKPRPALNIDINRNCCTFDTKENLAKGAHALSKVFKGFVRVKNMFQFSKSRAAMNFHYRTLMLSVLFEPGITFGELAKRPDVVKKWTRYGEAPPENPVEPWSRWRRHARAALDHLRSDAIAKKPVRAICETQLLLRPYFAARQRMHLLYQVCRAATSQQLFLDFRKVQASDFTWYKGSAEDIKNRTYESEQDNAFKEMQNVARNASKSRKNSLLHKHSLEGHEKCVKWLLENGANATHTSNYNTTALHTASFRGHLPVVKVLLEFGARVNDVTSDGSTALKNAASAGHSEIVFHLLGAGANPDLATKDGSTPLYHASAQGHVDICDMLCAANAQVNKAKKKGHTPLSMACKKGFADVVKLLINSGANVQNATRWDEVTPLRTAVEFGHALVVEEILKERLKFDKESAGVLVHACAEHGHTEILRILIEHIKRPKNIYDIPRNDGCSPLYIATEKGHYETVRLLLDSGASMESTRRRVKSTRQFGETKMIFDVFEIAKEKNHVSLLSLLEETRVLRSQKKKSRACVIS